MRSAIATTLMCLSLPGCDNRQVDAGYWAREREKIELTQRLKMAEYRIGQTNPEDLAELTQLGIRLREFDQRVRDLVQNRSALRAEIKAMEYRNDEAGRLAIQDRRTSAVGRKFDSFVLKDGRTLQNVAITGVDDSGVAIRHDHGTARLRYSDLSPEQNLIFGLEETSALAAENRELQESIAYERRIDLEIQSLRDKEERAAADAKRDDDAQVSRSLMARESGNQRTSPLAQPARQVGSGSWSRTWYGDSPYRSYRPTYRYVYYYPARPNPFCGARTYNSMRNIPGTTCIPNPNVNPNIRPNIQAEP